MYFLNIPSFKLIIQKGKGAYAAEDKKQAKYKKLRIKN